MSTMTGWPCKHCGVTHHTRTEKGRPSSVCRNCRTKQARASEARAKAAAVEEKRPRPRTVADRTSAIARAHDRAQAEGISLVTALKIEGVV